MHFEEHDVDVLVHWVARQRGATARRIGFVHGLVRVGVGVPPPRVALYRIALDRERANRSARPLYVERPMGQVLIVRERVG